MSFLPECDSANGYRTIWYDEPPQEVSSSSGGVVIRDGDCLVVNTCDVVCGRSRLSESGGGYSVPSGSCNRSEVYPEPRDVVRALWPGIYRFQRRDAGQLPRLCFCTTYNCRSPSVKACPPGECGPLGSGCSSSHGSVDSLFGRGFDDELVRWYHPHLGEGGQPLPAKGRMFDKWFGKMFRSRGKHSTAWDVTYIARLRNIKMNIFAIRNRWRTGQVARHNSTTFVRKLEGRRTNHPLSNMKVHGGTHVGKDCNCHGIPSALLSRVRIVYVDVRKARWCSVGSVAFHSSAWPTLDVKVATSIARTLWINHCSWADVLVVRGRCCCPP